MSIAISSRVWKTNLPASQKLVALALADHANEKGECWPSIKKISDKCGLNERTVFRNLNLLEKGGVVKRKKRVGCSTVYTLTPAQIVTPDECDPPDSDSTTPVEIVTLPLSNLSPRITKESPEETSHTPPLRQPPQSARFDEFWSVWPATDHKVDRKACETLWAKRGLDLVANKIIDHVKAMKRSKDWQANGDGKTFDPAPAKYLRNERWNDPIAPSTERHWV